MARLRTRLLVQIWSFSILVLYLMSSSSAECLEKDGTQDQTETDALIEEQISRIPSRHLIRPSVIVNHGCCQSEGYLTEYKALDNQFGKRVVLARVDNQAQKFYAETCKQLNNNCGCSCKIINATFTAVVNKGSNAACQSYKLEVVTAPSVCKCVNSFHDEL